MGCSQSICRIVIKSAAFCTTFVPDPACGSINSVPTPLCRFSGSKNITAAFTVAIPNPMGIMMSASRTPLRPKYISRIPKKIKPTRAIANFGCTANNVPMP